jgi:hypothetical protein
MPRKPKAIAMSAKSKVAWKEALEEYKIFSGAALCRAVNGEGKFIANPTAKAAFDGEPIEPKTWEKIMYELDLNWRDYFTKAEWYQWDLKTQWGMLLDLAVDASDRFGLVPPPEAKRSNSGWKRAVPASSNTPERYLKQVRMGEQFGFNIQVKTEGYLFIIEKDSLDEVFFLVDPILIDQTVSEIFIPANQKKEEYFTSSTIGKCELWAIVIPQEEKCKFMFLEDNCYYSCKNAEEQQPLKLQHLQMLLEYASENNEIEMIHTYYSVIK